MKKYKVGITDIGYEDIVEADDEQEAEEIALIHCKQYLQEYVDVDTGERNTCCLCCKQLRIPFRYARPIQPIRLFDLLDVSI